jgi:hypothetical protein
MRRLLRLGKDFVSLLGFAACVPELEDSLRHHGSMWFQWLLLAQVLMIAASSPAFSASGSGVASVSADAFLSSLGVNTHVDQGISGASYITPLRYLDIRNIRDLGRHFSQVQLMNRATGIRLDLVGAGDLERTMATGKALAASGALMAFEGPNEPNNFKRIFTEPSSRTGI